MQGDDPFGEDDGGKTVMRPRPGGRSADATRSGQPPRPAQRTTTPPPIGHPPAAMLHAALPATGINPLVAAAAPVLTLAARIRGSATVPDVEALRSVTAGELQQFEERAAQAGAPPETFRLARYVLAATVDDLAQNTPWGNDEWPARSMVSMFHREAFGGERFFEVLERARRDAARNLDLLELIFICLALGFAGQYRVTPQGNRDLDRIRDDLFRAIRNQRGEFERELSPHWRGVASAYAPLRRFVPVWLLGLACGGLLVAMFATFLFLLIGAREPALAALGSVPAAPTQVVRPPPPAVPVPPRPPAGNPVLDRLRAFLAPEIERGEVEVLPDGQAVRIRILDTRMFGSGSSDLEPAVEPLMRRIGEALRDEQGRVLVTGHTDNIPIRRSLRFPSNLELSQARAESVSAGIARQIGDVGRLTAEGRSDREPLVANDTPENRALNRRVEIQLFR